ncbi:winged helix-turn-helix domain-containing protein [Haloarcula vallismortis]|nr:winged helix-turn-helix domain-containing protein [Haloarcula vallismortis]
MARPEGSKEELEARRKQAVRLLNRTDMAVSDVAEVEGVTERAVYNWKRKYEQEGTEGLDAKPSGGGRQPELPDEKLPELEELLLEGAEAHGFEGDLWTLPRVARLLEEEFDVDVTPRTAGNYLDKLDWSNQRPQRRAVKRDPDEIAQWREEWEYRQKKPSDATKR